MEYWSDGVMNEDSLRFPDIPLPVFGLPANSLYHR